MRRRVRVIHLARRPLDPLLRELKSATPEKWPTHLGLAWILLNSKPGLPDKSALHIMVGSVSAAHFCAQAINRLSVKIVKFQTRDKLRNAFRRIAKCAKRAPAKLRKRLNESVIPLIGESSVDTEVIEAIFDAAIAAFKQFREEEAAKTALRLMCGMPPHYDQVVAF